MIQFILIERGRENAVKLEAWKACRGGRLAKDQLVSLHGDSGGGE